MEYTVDSDVISLEDLPFALSEGIDVPAGTKGKVKEVIEVGPEGNRLHVLWEVGGTRGQSVYNVNPSQVKPT